MGKRNTYSDLIKDADLIKEVSIEKAKSMLAEALTPHLRRALEQSINETEDAFSGDSDIDSKGDKEGEPLNQSIPTATNENDEEFSDEEFSDEEDSEEEDVLGGLGENDEEEYMPGNDAGMNGMGSEMSDEEMPEDDTDLDEIINSLSEEGYEDDEELGTGNDTMSNARVGNGADNLYPDMAGAGAGAEEEEEFEEPSKGDEVVESDKPVKKTAFQGTSIAEVKALRLEVRKLRKFNSQLREQIKHRDTIVRKVGAKLNETALMNSKLAFAYNLMNKFSLTRRERLVVLEQLDKATNVNEAKLIHSSLNESFKLTVSSKMRNITKGKAKINENVSHIVDKIAANRPVTLRDQLITEQVKNRWEALAGISGINDESNE